MFLYVMNVDVKKKADKRKHDKKHSLIKANDSARTATLLLLDSSPIFRANLSSALQQKDSIITVREFGSVAEVDPQINLSRIAVAVIDMSLDDQSGISLCMKWVSQRRELPVVMLCHNDWDVYLVLAHAAGAIGFLPRSTATQELVNAIQLATVRCIFTSDQLERIQSWEEKIGIHLRTLRPHEWQVLWLLTVGMKNLEIAERMSLAINTVEKYITSILRKMGLSSRMTLMAYVLQNQLDVLRQLPEGANPFAVHLGSPSQLRVDSSKNRNN